MVPALGDYFGDDGTLAAPVAVDGGYYTKAADNMPMVGPVPDAPRGCYMCAITRPLPPSPAHTSDANILTLIGALPVMRRLNWLSGREFDTSAVVVGAPRCRATA